MKHSKEIKDTIKFLLPYLRDHKYKIVPIALAMMLVAITSALSAYIFKHILNDIFIARDRQMLIILPIIVISIFTIRGLARFVSSYMTNKIAVTVANRLRLDMFSRLINAELRYKNNHTTGDINSIIIQTALNIQNIISKSLPQLLISLLTVISLIALILYTDVRLALYAIAVGILIVIPVKMLSKGVKKHTSDSENMVSKLSNRINESFSNLELIKVYNRESSQISLFDDFLSRYQNYQNRLARYQLLSSPFMEFFVASAIAVVIFIGGGFVVDGSMSAGDFFAFLVALMMLYAPIKNLTQNYTMFFALSSYIQRVKQILDIPQEETKSESSIESISSIRFENVSYNISQKSILKDITLKIEKNDRLAIVGKSGAGKSSLISLLCGLDKSSSGEIYINDKAITDVSTYDIRANISYVNQSAGVFNDSIRVNILYGKDMDEAKYYEAISDAKCDFIGDMQGGDNYIVGESGNKLSGGQRQRVAIARAIYKDASLFVLDEATSSLDTDTETQIQQALEKVLSNHTSIIIAHRLSTIKQCNKVVVLEDGCIVAQGDYDEVSVSEAFMRNFGVEK